MRMLAIVTAANLLAGCLAFGTAPVSQAYEQVEGLSWAERDAVLMRMPVEQRLDAYHDFYVRSGHPKMMLRRIFEGSAETTFDAVMVRMIDPSSFIEYFWIIHHLALRDELDVCETGRFGLLSEKARRLHIVNPKHPVPIQFDGCILPL